MNKERDKKQDIIKGIGILLVVNFHLIVYSDFASLLKFGWATSLLLIYFFLAGMNYTPGRRPIAQSIKIRVQGLLFPFFQYIALTVLICGGLIVARGQMTPLEIVQSVLNFIATGVHFDRLTDITACLIPAWFVVDLFLASILFFFAAQLVYESKVKTWCGILILLAVSTILAGLEVDVPVWHIQSIPGLAAVLLIGLEYKKSGVGKKLPQKPLAAVLIFLVSAAASCFLDWAFGGADELSVGQWGTVGAWSVPLAVFVLGINYLAFYALAVLVEKSSLLCRAAGWLGRHSLTILLIHLPIATAIGLILNISDIITSSQTFSWPMYFRDVVVILATMALTCLWCVFVDRCKGRKKSS